MESYKQRLAEALAQTGALFFDKGLVLKDGRPTPYFVNMACFRTGRLSLEMGSFFAGMMVARNMVTQTDILLGPSYKGSAIAVATGIALWSEYGHDLQVDYDRKEAKTHGEASAAKSLLVNQTLFDGCRILILDDVATSMKTKVDLLEKIGEEARRRKIACRVVGVAICVDREQTTAVYGPGGSLRVRQRGSDAVGRFVQRTGVPVQAVAGIREIVDYLYTQGIPVRIGADRRPMDPSVKAEFEAYMATYGVAGRVADRLEGA